MLGTSYLSLPEFNIINKIIFISRQHKPQFISIIRSQSYHKFWHTHTHSHFLAYFPHRAIEMKARHQVSGGKRAVCGALMGEDKKWVTPVLSDEPGRRGRRGRACAPFLIYFWHFRNDTDVFVFLLSHPVLRLWLVYGCATEKWDLPCRQDVPVDDADDVQRIKSKTCKSLLCNCFLTQLGVIETKRPFAQSAWKGRKKNITRNSQNALSADDARCCVLRSTAE